MYGLPCNSQGTASLLDTFDLEKVGLRMKSADELNLEIKESSMIKTITCKIATIKETLSKDGPELGKMHKRICIALCLLFVIAVSTAGFMFINFILKQNLHP
jgi:hypothetical protein